MGAPKSTAHGIGTILQQFQETLGTIPYTFEERTKSVDTFPYTIPGDQGPYFLVVNVDTVGAPTVLLPADAPANTPVIVANPDPSSDSIDIDTESPSELMGGDFLDSVSTFSAKKYIFDGNGDGDWWLI